MSQEAVDALVLLLDLEPIEVNIFRGVSPDEDRQRVFGGQVAGQALVAAGRTVERDDSALHSLHAYFLRPGDPNVPIVYDVDRIRDGKSFTTRRVVAIQHGRAIFTMAASFHVREDGFEHQLPMPGVPDPETLPTLQARLAPYKDKLGDWLERPRPIDQRYVSPTNGNPFERRRAAGLEPHQLLWLRADGTLPDDPMLHACVVTYASDLSLLDTSMLPHQVSPWDNQAWQVASLDHAMWFHRPFRADEWLLYEQESPSAAAARGFNRGSIFTRDGRLVVSVMQEGLIRQVRSK
jgi:acyl-CoA thioesterase II